MFEGHSIEFTQCLGATSPNAPRLAISPLAFGLFTLYKISRSISRSETENAPAVIARAPVKSEDRP